MTDMTTGIKAAKYLMGLGEPPLPKNGAVASISVFWVESKLNPGSQGVQPTEHPGILNPHGAYGIMSLNADRQQHLKDFCYKHGLPYDNLESQLRFYLNDAANRYPRTWTAIRSGASVNAIIAAIVDEYENPKDKQSEIARAEAYAAELAPLVPDTVPPVVTEPTPIPIPTGLPDMNPALIALLGQIIGLIVQAVPPAAFANIVQSIVMALFHHAAGQTIPTLPTPHAPSPPPTTAPGAIDWGTILQEIVQVLSKASPQK